jgi:HEAT repeat protein
MWSAGSMTARYYGYALALTAWLRGEARPAWRRHLRRDAEDALLAGLRYLQATGDAIFSPADPLAATNRTANQLADDLREGTPSRRVATLWQVAALDDGPEKSRLAEAVASNLQHPDPTVRCEAAAAIGTCDPLGSDGREMLIQALSDRSAQVRRAAAWACGQAVPDATVAVPALLPLLGDRSLNVANAAAWALHHYGRRATEAVPELVRLLRVGELHGQGVLVEEVLESLAAISDDPAAAIVAHLAERDEETCRRLLDALAAWQVQTDPSSPS